MHVNTRETRHTERGSHRADAPDRSITLGRLTAPPGAPSGAKIISNPASPDLTRERVASPHSATRATGATSLTLANPPAYRQAAIATYPEVRSPAPCTSQDPAYQNYRLPDAKNEAAPPAAPLNRHVNKRSHHRSKRTPSEPILDADSQFIMAHNNYLWKVIWSFHHSRVWNRLHKGLQLSVGELYTVASLTLLRARSQYDETRPASFLTFASTMIFYALRKYVLLEDSRYQRFSLTNLKARQEYQHVTHAPQEETDTLAEIQKQEAIIEAIMEVLTDESAISIVLYYFTGYSVLEIASIMDLSHSTISRRNRKSLDMITTYVTQFTDEAGDL